MKLIEINRTKNKNTFYSCSVSNETAHFDVEWNQSDTHCVQRNWFQYSIQIAQS